MDTEGGMDRYGQRSGKERHEPTNEEDEIEIKTKGERSNREGNSVQLSRSVVSDSLPPHEPQHARPPCPSPTPRVHPNSCPLSQ